MTALIAAFAPPSENTIAGLESPLIAPVNTRAALGRVQMKPETNVYFGTGLATRSELSCGVPFDALQMLILAEQARRITGGAKIFHEISDNHVLETRSDVTAADVSVMADEQRETYRAAARYLGLDSVYECVRASEYQGSPAYAACLQEVENLAGADENAYVRLQSAGNVYFAREKGVGVKVGWLTDDTPEIKGADERWFNRFYDALEIAPLSFIYGFSGLTFDVNRTRVSPYTLTRGERRLRMTPEGTGTTTQTLQDFIGACGNTKITRRVLAHYAKLVAGIDQLTGAGTSRSAWSDQPESIKDGRFLCTEKGSWTKGASICVDGLARAVDQARTAIAQREPANAFTLNPTTTGETYACRIA